MRTTLVTEKNGRIAALFRAFTGRNVKAMEARIYIPIYDQILNRGVRSGIETVVAPDDVAEFRYPGL